MSDGINEEDRENWLVHIAHDIGAFGHKKAFRIIDRLRKGEDRLKVRKLFNDVVMFLKSTEEYDVEEDVEDDEED